MRVLKDQLDLLAKLADTKTARELFGINSTATAVKVAIKDLCEKIQHYSDVQEGRYKIIDGELAPVPPGKKD